ncbi:MAG: protein-S-isoprenylcysteine O-methyltransferase [Bacteroidota bacterium]
MSIWVLKTIFMIFWVATGIIRRPFDREQKRNTIVVDHKTTLEKILLSGAMLGMMLFPVLYVFTDWFSFADYSPVLPVNIIGIMLMPVALWLFYRSHKDLGKNWSPTLEIRSEHTLVSNGVYQHIRHPMYTAIWIWVILQACVLPNWVGGFAGIISFGTLYFLRIGEEEAMMQKQFGEQYQTYKSKTKRLIPYIL